MAIKLINAAVPEKLINNFLAWLSLPCVLVFGAVASARAARVASTEEFVWSWLSVTNTDNSQIQTHFMFLHWLNFVYRKKPFPPQYPFRIYSPLFKVFTLFLDTRKSPSLIFFIGRCPIFTNISPCPPLVFYSAPIQAYQFICKKNSHILYTQQLPHHILCLSSKGPLHPTLYSFISCIPSPSPRASYTTPISPCLPSRSEDTVTVSSIFSGSTSVVSIVTVSSSPILPICVCCQHEQFTMIWFYFFKVA